jgi:electron transfer flavoprotein beta subunit
MHIVVLAKVVPDYEVPSGDFELINRRAHNRYKRMIGLYDENAIETAVQIKEKYQAALSIISYGIEEDIPVLRKAVAMGGEKLLLINGDSDDPLVIAANLKATIDSIGNVDLVLAGQQSADMDRGVVPGLLAQMLGYPYIPRVSHVESDNSNWKVIQQNEDGIRKLSFSGKGVISITSVPENVPRIPAVRDIFAAKKKPVEKLAAVGVNKMNVEEIAVEIPKMESVCEFLPMDDVRETAKLLLLKLREERYL